MATYVNPFEWSDVEVAGELAHAFRVEAMQALLRLAETMNPMELGMLSMQGLIGGVGSDTIRVPDQTNLAGTRPTALASETARPSYVSHVLGYTDFSVASYGNARSQTYDSQMFNMPAVAGALSIESYLAAVPGMVAAHMRYLLGQAIAGISASVGSTSVKTSYDTMIAAAVAFNANGYQPLFGGNPIAALHPNQWEHVKESVRVEPGFQMNGLATGIQGLNGSAYLPDPLGLGMDVALTTDITTATSAYQGGLYDRGGVGVAFGDTGRITPAVGTRALMLPQVGVLLQEVPDGAGERTREAQFFQWAGVAMGSTNVFRQTRVIGATT